MGFGFSAGLRCSLVGLLQCDFWVFTLWVLVWCDSVAFWSALVVCVDLVFAVFSTIVLLCGGFGFAATFAGCGGYVGLVLIGGLTWFGCVW